MTSYGLFQAALAGASLWAAALAAPTVSTAEKGAIEAARKLGFTVFQVPHLIQLGGTDESEILRAWGTPIRTYQWIGHSGNDPTPVRFKELFYPGLKITLTPPETGSRCIRRCTGVDRIELSSASYQLVGSLRIGDPLSKFQAFLHDSRQTTGNRFEIGVTYDRPHEDDVTEEYNVAITLRLDRAQRVKTVIWTYYAD